MSAIDHRTMLAKRISKDAHKVLDAAVSMELITRADASDIAALINTDCGEYNAAMSELAALVDRQQAFNRTK